MPFVEHQAVYIVSVVAHTRDWIGEHGDVERVELVAVLLLVELRRASVRGDDDVARPRREIECHADRSPAVADHDDLLALAVVTVAVGAHVRVRAVDVLHARDVGPDVAQSDRQEQPVRGDAIAALQAEQKRVVVVQLGAQHDGVAQMDADRAARVSSARTQLGRRNAVESEVSVDPARVPIARITAVDQRDGMEIAPQPCRRAQPGGAAADNRDLEVCVSRPTRTWPRKRQERFPLESGRVAMVRLRYSSAHGAGRKLVEQLQRCAIGRGDVGNRLDRIHLRARIVRVSEAECVAGFVTNDAGEAVGRNGPSGAVVNGDENLRGLEPSMLIVCATCTRRAGRLPPGTVRST